MKKFNEFLTEGRIKEEQLNDWISVFTWEDISDLYGLHEFESTPETLSEKISATTRLRKSQQLKTKSAKLQMARQMKLLRTSTPAILNRRAKEAARRMLIKKLLQGKDKSQLSAQERDRIEQSVSNLISTNPVFVQKMIMKVKKLEQSRLISKNNTK